MNIYLIGFMGAGKSTIAELLCDRLHMELVEMDERIVKEQGMPITGIFEKYGEDHFREIESALVRTIAEEGNTVVSCGGGVVIRPENTQEMKRSGKNLRTRPLQQRPSDLKREHECGIHRAAHGEAPRAV